MTERKVLIEQDSEMLRIYIDDLPHCILYKKQFAGFYSYKQGGVYCVEIWKPKGKRELLTHETRELWEKILKALDEAL